MRITNCRGCGRIFNILADEELCPNCQRKLDEKFDKVRKFIEDNPNSSVEVVSRETETSTRQLRKWIREERLTFSPDSAYGIECEKCGKMIRTGKYCAECKKALANTFRNMLDTPKKENDTSIKNRDREHMRYIK